MAVGLNIQTTEEKPLEDLSVFPQQGPESELTSGEMIPKNVANVGLELAEYKQHFDLRAMTGNQFVFCSLCNKISTASYRGKYIMDRLTTVMTR